MILALQCVVKIFIRQDIDHSNHRHLQESTVSLEILVKEFIIFVWGGVKLPVRPVQKKHCSLYKKAGLQSSPLIIFTPGSADDDRELLIGGVSKLLF